MPPEPVQLEGRRVLITGGTGGIGRAVASHMCALGATVCITGTKAETLIEPLALLQGKYPDRVFGIACDVSHLLSVECAVEEVATTIGGLDVLVNAAGIQSPIGAFLDNDLDEWERNLRVNLMGAVYCTKAVLPLLLGGNAPAIVNFSGGGATGSRVNFSAYAVAKAGLVRFTEVLADELRDSGVRVNAIAPGAINTRMLDEVLAAGPRAGAKELKEATERSESGGASVDSAAQLVAFLASPASAPLTGKLVSAVWDPWRTWDLQALEEIMKGSQYNLRRVS
jgi:3-oxoacyl-[acyl-carrier protein] reductase